MKPSKELGTIFGSDKRVPPHTNYPKDRTAAERRSESRTGDRLPVQFFDVAGGPGYQGTLINGSEGGAFIETHKTLPLLTRIRVEGPGVTCQAVVCRVHWLGPEERVSRSGGMAIRLISRKEHNQGTVLSFTRNALAK